MSKPTIDPHLSVMKNYIEQTKGNTIQELIDNHHQALLDFYNSIPEEKADFQYAPGKWTVKNVLSHVIDTDMVFAYRALVISRGEKQILPGFDQDQFVEQAESSRLLLADLKELFTIQREWIKYLAPSFSDGQLSRIGNVSDYQLSVNAVCFMLFGHALHHKKILRERYLI